MDLREKTVFVLHSYAVTGGGGGVALTGVFADCARDIFGFRFGTGGVSAAAGVCTFRAGSGGAEFRVFIRSKQMRHTLCFSFL